jgi:metal-responsive CopG/Arc/MetJ family transcriptional regulator
MDIADKTYVPVNIRMKPELVEAIDNFRRFQPAIISRSEVIRMFVEKGLERQNPGKLQHA